MSANLNAMLERHQKLLQHIVELYADSAQPVGSVMLAHTRGLDVSPATIRNDMAKLEEAGLIAQPHTSAGRIPTIAGIEFYLQNLMRPRTIPHQELQKIKAVFSEQGIKGVAKHCAQSCRSAVIVAKDMDDFYYTGFSYLFSHPEYTSAGQVQAISRSIDELESVLPYFNRHASHTEPKIFIGSTNPLGHECSATFIKSQASAHRVLFGILSPLRTDYARQIGVLSAIKDYL